MTVKDNLDFDEFIAEVGVAQMGIASNQTDSSLDPQHHLGDS